MMNIRSFSEAQRVLMGYVPKDAQKSYTLDRMRQLMKVLGSPQEKYKVVHVAGTSGKTSTSYYIAAFLVQANQKVGLTVSPHIDEVNERIQLNLLPLPETEYCKKLGEFIEAVDQTNIKPTYFELLIAFAYWEFANQQVDYAVVEVGLGGLLDGTNVINRSDKICLITDIDLDHTEVLGKTLSKIAAQKAGIIKPENDVFIYKQTDEVMTAIGTVVDKQKAKLHIVELKEKPSSQLPLFQQRNINLANSVFKFIQTRDNLNPLDPKKLNAVEQTQIPARMEIIKQASQTLIIDGSHNTQKIKTLLESIKQKFPGQKIAALVSFVDSEESRTKGAVSEIVKEAEELIITTFSGEQDTPKHSVAAEKIARFCQELNFTNYTIIEEPEAALAELLKNQQPILLVTGSFYLLNHIRPLILKA